MAQVPTPEEGLRQRLTSELDSLRSEAGRGTTRYAITRLHPSLEKRQVRFGIWNAPNIALKRPSYRVVRQDDLGRLDNIAVEYYEDPRLWWAIAHVNKIYNVHTDMVVGMTLIIPRKEEITKAIETGDAAVFES